MREAGVSSTRSKLQGCCLECARPTGGSHTRTTRGPAQRRGGRKAKAALSNRGGLEQRGIQHTHYKGRDALKHNSEPGHLGSCAWLIGVGLCRRSPRPIARRPLRGARNRFSRPQGLRSVPRGGGRLRAPALTRGAQGRRHAPGAARQARLRLARHALGGSDHRRGGGPDRVRTAADRRPTNVLVAHQKAARARRPRPGMAWYPVSSRSCRDHPSVQAPHQVGPAADALPRARRWAAPSTRRPNRSAVFPSLGGGARPGSWSALLRAIKPREGASRFSSSLPALVCRPGNRPSVSHRVPQPGRGG